MTRRFELLDIGLPTSLDQFDSKIKEVTEEMEELARLIQNHNKQQVHGPDEESKQTKQDTKSSKVNFDVFNLEPQEW
jgi:agmatine/peptidylarginine deiminase